MPTVAALHHCAAVAHCAALHHCAAVAHCAARGQHTEQTREFHLLNSHITRVLTYYSCSWLPIKQVRHL